MRDVDADSARRSDQRRGPTSCGRCCTARPARTVRSATCSTSLGVAVRRVDARRLPARLGQADRQGRRRAPPVWRPRASVALPHATFRELGAEAVLDAIVDRLGLPLMVKPARGGSALGVSVVREAADLPAAMVGCFAYGDIALIERFVDGRRGRGQRRRRRGRSAAPCPPSRSCPTAASTTTTRATPPVPPSSSCPARLSDDVAAAVADTAAARRTGRFGLRDLSRTDLIVDREGRPGSSRSTSPPA